MNRVGVAERPIARRRPASRPPALSGPEALLFFYAMHEEPQIRGSLYEPGGFENPVVLHNAIETARVINNQISALRWLAAKRVQVDSERGG